MIILITGKPGDGKTLYAINYVKAWAEREQRPVLQSGIEIRDPSALPWAPLAEPEKWYEAPTLSIVVIDEAQRIFRSRVGGTAVPRSVSEFETHRHLGIDIVLITQHPGLIDPNIRKLVGRHFHVTRRWGGQSAAIREWESCREISKASIKDAVPHYFTYPKASFGWYKSAEVHTHKKRVPMRVRFMYAVPLIIVGAVGFAWWKLHGIHADADAPAVTAASSAASRGAGVVVGGGRAPAHHLSRAEWLDVRVPRLAGLVHTAPLYDELTQPTRVAVPVACVRNKTRCLCYSQDATMMDVGTGLCMDIVARGFFLDFAPEKKSDQGGPKSTTGAPQSAAAQPSVAAVPGRAVGASVAPSGPSGVAGRSG